MEKIQSALEMICNKDLQAAKAEEKDFLPG